MFLFYKTNCLGASKVEGERHGVLEAGLALAEVEQQEVTAVVGLGHLLLEHGGWDVDEVLLRVLGQVLVLINLSLVLVAIY